MNPTVEQQAIIERPPRESIKVAAGAGCGKTSTLVQYGHAWPTRGLYIAFNKSIAADAGGKFPAHVRTSTGHSYAYRALDMRGRTLIENLRIEHLKPYNALIRPVAGLSDYQVRSALLRTLGNFMIDGGSKITAHHCPLPHAEHRNAVRKIAGDVAGKMLRFRKHDLPMTHDTYLKAFELWHRVEGFDYLMLDEAQDLNPVLVSIARKAEIPLIIVGDSYQSIYLFRGAVNAMAAFDVDEFPLSQSWRFGPKIATLANRILQYHSRRPRHLLSGNPGRETEVLRYNGRLALGPGHAVLARTNARLFDGLALLNKTFHLIGGFTNLKRQIASAHALKNNQLQLVTDSSVLRFTTWRALDHAAERGDVDAKRLRDIVEKYEDQLPAILARLADLYRENEQDAQIVVSTAHRAKGREWHTVTVLDDFEEPSEIRRQRLKDHHRTDDCDQSVNLLYVAATRATHRLYLAHNLFDDLQLS